MALANTSWPLEAGGLSEESMPSPQLPEQPRSWRLVELEEFSMRMGRCYRSASALARSPRDFDQGFDYCLDNRKTLIFQPAFGTPRKPPPPVDLPRLRRTAGCAAPARSAPLPPSR